MKKFIEILGLVGAVGMPLWNIPLVMRIIRRRSSADISQSWLWGVWGCVVIMLPSTLISNDLILRVFGFTNLVLFSAVVVVVMKYRKSQGTKTE